MTTTTSSADRAVREHRAARRAALRAAHPDLGGDTEAFIGVVRAFEQSRPPVPGVDAAAAGPGAGGARPVVFTTWRSRASRRARRARRRLRALADRCPTSRSGRHHTYLSEEQA